MVMAKIFYGFALMLFFFVGYGCSFVKERYDVLDYIYFHDVSEVYKGIPVALENVTECFIQGGEHQNVDWKIAKVLSGYSLRHTTNYSINYATSEYFASIFIGKFWKTRKEQLSLYLYLLPFDRNSQFKSRGIIEMSELIYHKKIDDVTAYEFERILFSTIAGVPSLENDPVEFQKRFQQRKTQCDHHDGSL